MKKSILFAAMAAMFLCSCGTTQKVNQSKGLGEEIAKSPAQMYAEDPSATTLRAWAKYQGLQSQPIEQLAAAQARGELATSIAALVKTAIKTYAGQYGKEQLSAEQVEKIMSADNKAEQSLEQLANELVQYAPAKVTNSYRQSDGTVIAYVCVELHPTNILNAVKKNKEYQDVVNANQKMQIDFASEKFDESMKSSFDELQQKKEDEKKR